MTKYKIYVKKETDKGKISRDVSMITDGKMVTRHNDPADSFKIYTEKKRKGENVEWKRGILVEYFEDKTADEIRDHVEKELRVMEIKFKKEMDIVWRVENVE